MSNFIPIGTSSYAARLLASKGFKIYRRWGEWHIREDEIPDNHKGIRFIVTDEVVTGNNGMFTKKDRVRAQRINKAKKRVNKAVEYFMGDHTSLGQREKAYLKLEKERKHLYYLTKGSES